MKPHQQFLRLAVLGVILGLAACTGPPEPPAAPSEDQATPGEITWPDVVAVLDGTDLVEMQQTVPVQLLPSGIGGDYGAEQGGALLSLTVRFQDGALDLERRYEEPGEESVSKRYQLQITNSEGAASSASDICLKQTSEGLLLWEKDSGIEGIPSTYWVHYIAER